MKHWKEDYINALHARDLHEKSQEHYMHAYAKLADRAANLERQSYMLRSPESRLDNTFVDDSHPVASEEKRITATANVQLQQQTLLSDLRKELSTTQKVRAQLQKKAEVMAEEIEQITAKSGIEKRRAEGLSKEKASLERKLRDRDEELLVKTRLVEEVHNEMISLNLQLNMAEQRSGKLENDNKELVERWMKLKSREADDMNKASDWQ